ncbi:LytR/AlgR family response regulator transcription factor [Desulfitibacter alkalitolerans]|uniref:LytR/AlgR family response regulator transcription factor n=1 Tax=Desulfitibacter alkalitolerans TaxID=264641 RepID=UPI0004800E4E|nr:LytTR family DNA-binding domain-containing protein [Desulfitibacter alkalitolerans]
MRVLIVEDDPKMRLILKKSLAKLPGTEIVGEAVNGVEAVKMTETLNPQVIFMDIDLPEKDGIEASREIQDINPDIFLIYATGHSTYMQEAFELYAFDYLLKPYKLERIKETIEKINYLLELKEKAGSRNIKTAPQVSSAKKVAVKVDRNLVFIDAEKIIFMGREKRKTSIITNDNKQISTYEPLDTLDNRIGKDSFFRAHQSFLINLDMIAEIQPWSRSTYLVVFNNTKKTAFMTEEKYKVLQQRFNLE